MTVIKRFEINAAGRDFAVGDIHGNFNKLQAALDAVSFEPKVDRLFSVGDLVDRGPESDLVLEWLTKPWFHAVQGNHEDMAVKYVEQTFRDGGLYLQNGGAWLMAKNRDEQHEFKLALAELPIAIEVSTAEGTIGIVHADCAYQSWSEFIWALENAGPAETDHVKGMAQWSRNRITQEDRNVVGGVRALVVGHTPLRRPTMLGNVLHIDTAAWMGGYFTLVDLATLECHPPINPKMHWDWEQSA